MRTMTRLGADFFMGTVSGSVTLSVLISIWAAASEAGGKVCSGCSISCLGSKFEAELVRLVGSHVVLSMSCRSKVTWRKRLEGFATSKMLWKRG
ncbi:hypothetical protein BC939DRAFT_440272 [Gamsiella multidivaricata]|uniref:uncharacterized protein n=1 Tax=Gamsiella multidivaricata TaxID=101098 RepID=UPI00222024F0|nr:uncharacterized protein BC939DRAFT_440272 [Gamsiella multidivaricata]KAI7829700.1 hypothetical protein BC939DRAFT_440272 [Gamsiella multidivaricata]